jgi:uncharacterized membrane protein
MGEDKEDHLNDSNNLPQLHNSNRDKVSEISPSENIKIRFTGYFSKIIHSKYLIIANKHRHAIIIILIILLGSYIRLTNLTDSGLYTDEAFRALVAEDVLSGSATDNDLTIGMSKIFHIYILKISFFFFGASEFAARLPSVIFGIGTIILMIQLGKKLHNKNVGYLAGFLLAISAWHIKWSIIAKEYSLFMFLASLTIYFLVIAVLQNNNRYYYIMGCVLFLSLLTTRFSLILPIIIIGYLALLNKIKNVHLWISIILPSAIWAVLNYPEIERYGLFHPIYSGDQWWVETNPMFYINIIIINLSVLAIIALFYSIYKILIKPKKEELKEEHRIVALSIFYVGTYFLLLAYFLDSKVDRYLSVIIPFIYLLVSYGFLELYHVVKNKFHPHRLFFILLVILLCVGDIGMLISIDSSSGYRDDYETEWREACAFIKEDLTEEDIVISTVIEPAYYYLRRPILSYSDDWNVVQNLINNDYQSSSQNNSNLWFVADKGRFYNSISSDQRQSIWDNLELVWESKHNYVFEKRYG